MAERTYIVSQTSVDVRPLHVVASTEIEAIEKARRGEITYYGEYRTGTSDYFIAGTSLRMQGDNDE